MNVLVTGISGYIGSRLAPRLEREGHAVRGMARDPARITLPVPTVAADAVTGAGLDRALEGIEVAYYLIHSMEPSDASFAVRDRVAAENFAQAARHAGVSQIVYLGGLVPSGAEASSHLASRLEVERILLGATPASTALRASIVIGAGSRSFRFLVRLVERLPVLALPAWRRNRTAPIDERDVIELLTGALGEPAVSGRSLDIGGPDVVAYGGLIKLISDHLLLDRPRIPLPWLSLTPIASRISALIAGEDHSLIGPLMEGLSTDLLPRDGRAAELLGVKLHSLDAAIERALRELEDDQPLAAR